jgi:hypothetical protein
MVEIEMSEFMIVRKVRKDCDRHENDRSRFGRLFTGMHEIAVKSEIADPQKNLASIMSGGYLRMTSTK